MQLLENSLEQYELVPFVIGAGIGIKSPVAAERLGVIED